MATYHLYRWSVTSFSDNPWHAPEQRQLCLVGFRDQETKRVITSTIKEVNGREITTETGSKYLLEDIDPEYLSWMDAEGLVYDPINPIKVKKAN
jgi:hypothetical protein